MSVCDLGAWFDDNILMNAHIGKVCSKAFYGLYKIRQIRKCLSHDDTKTLGHVFVTSHLDHCNLLVCLDQHQMDHLQWVLNAVACITCLLPWYSHITLVLIDLHWLPVAFRVKFKIPLIVCKALKGIRWLLILLDWASPFQDTWLICVACRQPTYISLRYPEWNAWLLETGNLLLQDQSVE